MKRRHFVGAVGAGSVAAMAGCAPQETRCEGTVENTSAEIIKWNMVTTWPKNFQGLGEGAEHIAQLINQMSGGRLQVKVLALAKLFRSKAYSMPWDLVLHKWAMELPIIGAERCLARRSSRPFPMA